MSKLFFVTSEYDIGNEETPYQCYFKAENIKKVHRYLENYCCSVGMNYEDESEDGMFVIKEIQWSDIAVDLDK